MPVSRFSSLRSTLAAVSGAALFALPLGSQTAAPDRAARRGPSDPAELGAFFDSVMAAQMADHNVAGAIVAVVRDGRVALLKGYGLADVEARKPVDPERTLFRIGSVTKLFTWTAVMQLVEQGRLDLDRNIEQYLDFSIPDTYPEPVTLRHLLTHTAGFEEDNRDQETADPAEMEPMSEWLPAHLPARVRPPGVFSAYSNWGAATAGYIVERVAGLPFDEYLEQRVLVPLGMTRTTSRQPLPARYRDDMSQGYAWENGAFAPRPWEIVKGAGPAASISSSASDMAKWMLVHLNRGRLGEVRILSDATAGLMHQRSFGHDPRVNGWGLGFYERSSHGLRIIGHGGGSRWFHTDLALVPEENLGIFVSYNTSTGGELAFGPFLETVLDHYYPAPAPTPVTHADLARFAGTYRFNRISYTTFQKAMSLVSGLRVRALDDTALVLDHPFAGSPLVPVDSMLFRTRTGSTTLAFRSGANGDITHGFLGLTPMMVLERQPWHSLPLLHLTILLGGLVAFAAFLTGFLLRQFRRSPGSEHRATPQLAAPCRLLAAAAAANLLFAVALSLAASNEQALLSDSPTALRIALAFPVLGILFLAAGAWPTLRLWREQPGTTPERWGLTAMLPVGALFAWSLNYWNLLGWRM